MHTLIILPLNPAHRCTQGKVNSQSIFILLSDVVRGAIISPEINILTPRVCFEFTPAFFGKFQFYKSFRTIWAFEIVLELSFFVKLVKYALLHVQVTVFLMENSDINVQHEIGMSTDYSGQNILLRILFL